MAMLGEAIVHGEDIRGPLGIHRSYPTQTITRVAEYYRGSDQVVLAKGRITGLRLAATDGPFTAGSGPLVSGTTLALTMAMTGRAAFCGELDGDGVATLRNRGRDSMPGGRSPSTWLTACRADQLDSSRPISPRRAGLIRAGRVDPRGPS